MESQQHSESFSVADRPGKVARLANEEFDLLIIGGGITGAGAARDAASRGMKVALIEAKDYAIGTSSRSSKLIHGGIRYLENMEFGLVFEALSERRLLFELAPHLVHPLRFVLPLYKGGRVGMFKMGLGMWLYDALSMFEAPELHERLTAKESTERLPLLQTKDLMGSYVYSDAYMDDDRLCIETHRAAAKLGTVAANYVTANDAEIKNGKIASVGATDTTTGKSFRIRSKHVISTTGPWTDLVASQLLGNWKKILRPSKGVHLTFDRKR
ncbi:MAG: FAD-dependent oxidoreductase, partial [Bdellovibrionota bacterium]